MKFTAGVIFLLAFSGLLADYPSSYESYPEYTDEFEDRWVAYLTSDETEAEYGDKTEGDLILSIEQRLYLETNPPNNITSTKFRWPKGRVYYRIHDDHFDLWHKKYILQAMKQIEEVSCVRFFEARDYERDYINITGFPDNCYAQVGRIGLAQPLNFHPHELDTGCFRLGTMLHEFLHALGFFHQNNVANRDTYITTVPVNMRPYKLPNFYRYETSFVKDFGLGYDYDSVLHFHSKAFSKNGEDTISVRSLTAKIGQREGMSTIDIANLNKMYDCPADSNSTDFAS